MNNTVWEILDTGLSSAQNNMDIDRELLSKLSQRQQPLLHFYGWLTPSATYGHFAQPAHYLHPTSIEKLGLQLAKRPTGGGILLHLTDLTFSMLIPSSHPSFTVNTMDNYEFVNQIVANAIKKFTNRSATLLPSEPVSLDEACNCFCMSKPTKYDVMLDGYKVSGGAQRRTRFGYLHQGTIALQRPKKELLDELLLPGNRILEGMHKYGGALIADHCTAKDLEDARQALKRCIINSLLN